jgi:type I restriction enzyme R subunit
VGRCDHRHAGIGPQKTACLGQVDRKSQEKIVYTDFEDEMGDSTTIILPGVSSGMSLTKFKDKARQFLKAHEDHLSLQCLRCNQALTASDLNALGQMLVAAGGSAEVIQQATEQSQGLGIFIRSLVGLDRETAKQAFS